jgi:chromosomal replication initiation ATPase DnaA
LSDWVIPHYGNKVDTICKKIFVGIKKTKIIVNAKNNVKSNNFHDFVNLTSTTNLSNNPSPLDPRFNFSNFVVEVKFTKSWKLLDLTLFFAFTIILVFLNQNLITQTL